MDVNDVISPKWGLFGVGINWASINEPHTVMIACALLISLFFFASLFCPSCNDSHNTFTVVLYKLRAKYDCVHSVSCQLSAGTHYWHYI